MRRLPVLLPLLLALALPLVAAPARAAAKPKPLIGIGDQNFLMFQDKRFTRLHLQLTRLALPWAAVGEPRWRPPTYGHREEAG